MYVCKCIGKVWKKEAILLTVLEPEIGEGDGSVLEEKAKGNFPSCLVGCCVVWIFHTENVSMHHLGN